LVHLLKTELLFIRHRRGRPPPYIQKYDNHPGSRSTARNRLSRTDHNGGNEPVINFQPVMIAICILVE
jgi:hypothetical protein